MASAFSWVNQLYRSTRLRSGLKALSALALFTSGFSAEPGLDCTSKRQGEVQIGPQVWMTENLNVASFRNGDLIPQAKSNQGWQRAARDKQPAWCYYNNEARMGKKYGRLYNWYAVRDPRGLCPSGWHAPTLAEWVQFEKVVEGRQAALLFECEAQKDVRPTNFSKGFCILAGGYRFSDGSFSGIGEFTYLSGATDNTIEDSNRTGQPVLWGRGLQVVDRTTMRCGLGKAFGLYVRCIKDKSR